MKSWKNLKILFEPSERLDNFFYFSPLLATKLTLHSFVPTTKIHSILLNLCLKMKSIRPKFSNLFYHVYNGPSWLPNPKQVENKAEINVNIINASAENSRHVGIMKVIYRKIIDGKRWATV